MAVPSIWPPVAGWYEEQYPTYAETEPGRTIIVCMTWLPVVVWCDTDQGDGRDGWRALVNGFPADIHCRIWPEVSGRPISQAKYQAMIAEGGGTEKKKPERKENV